MNPGKPREGVDMRRWIADFYQYVTKEMIGSGKGVRVNNIGDKIIISAKAKVGTGDSSESAYDGYFAVIKSDTEGSVDIVDGYDTEADYCGVIVAGLTKTDVTWATLAIENDGYVVMKVTWDTVNEVYKAEFERTDSWPEQVSGTLYVPLAYVEINNDETITIKKIRQLYQRGDALYLTGRAV